MTRAGSLAWALAFLAVAVPAVGQELPPESVMSVDPSIAGNLDPSRVTDAIDPNAVDVPLGPDSSGAIPVSLPSGPGKSAVTPQAISLPSAEGSIQGLTEVPAAGVESRN